MSKQISEINVNIPPELIRDLLTDSEWRMVKQRYFIFQLIKRKLSIRNIASRAKVGTDTVVRMLKKIESSKILKNFLKESGQEEISSSKWVFGGAEREE